MQRQRFALLTAVALVAGLVSQVGAQTETAPGKEGAAAAEQLRQTIAAAAQKHSTLCNQSVWAVAEKFGIKDLSGKVAKDQLAHVSNKQNGWKEITPKQAQELVNQGKLAIAGHGTHVAIPVPGELDSRYHHPKLAGGSLNSDTPGVPGKAYSTDGQSVNWVFKKSAVPEIKYYAPIEGQAIQVPAAGAETPVSFQPSGGKSIEFDDNAPKSPAIPHPGGVLMKMGSDSSNRRTGVTSPSLLNRLRPGN